MYVQTWEVHVHPGLFLTLTVLLLFTQKKQNFRNFDPVYRNSAVLTLLLFCPWIPWLWWSAELRKRTVFFLCRVVSALTQLPLCLWNSPHPVFPPSNSAISFIVVFQFVLYVVWIASKLLLSFELKREGQIFINTAVIHNTSINVALKKKHSKELWLRHVSVCLVLSGR